MTIFDYLVLFVLVSSVVISTLRGLVKEILSLLGWIVAFVVANAYGARLAPMLPEPCRPRPRRIVRSGARHCNRACRRHIVWDDSHSTTGFLERRAAVAHGGNRRAHRQAFPARCAGAARRILNQVLNLLAIKQSSF